MRRGSPVFLALLLSSGFGTALAQEARLTRLQGTVYLRLQGMPEGQFIAAKTGSPLQEGDEVRTGADGSAELCLDGQSVIQLSPRSDFSIGPLKPSGTAFSLGFGTLLAKLRHLLTEQRMGFQVGDAVAAVRGTELGLSREDESKPSIVGVFEEGRVEVRSGTALGKPVTLEPGQETELAPGAGPAAPHPLKALKTLRRAMRKLQRRLEDLRKGWAERTTAEKAALRKDLLTEETIRLDDLRKPAPQPNQGDRERKQQEKEERLERRRR